MARGYTTRKLEVFSLHARTKHGVIDYGKFFASLARLDSNSRQKTRNENLIALPRIRVGASRIHLIAYEGPVGVQPLIFDSVSAQERIQKLGSKEVVATRTHCVIDLASREAIIEYNHRGAKATDIEELLNSSGRALPRHATLELHLSPKVEASFLDAIDKFGRVRVASVRVARPNFDWNDNYNSLRNVAQESEAHTVSLEVTAGRGTSLSLFKGIVTYVRQMVREELSTLRGARLTGIRKGESSETTVSIANFVEHQRINVRMTEDGHVDSADIVRHMDEFLDARSPGGKRK
jgi:hypothetical protein